MTGFKKLVARDNRYLVNTNEYGEHYHIRYDGEVYRNVQAIVTGMRLEDYTRRFADGADGIFHETTKIHVLLDDIGGAQPEKGTLIELSEPLQNETYFEEVHFTVYRIIKSILEIGMVILEVEAYLD